MEHTVQTLIDYHKQLNQSRNPATVRNEISALKQFVKSLGISLGSPVPACFGADGDFNKAVNDYLEKGSFPDTTANSKRTFLKNIRESYLALIFDSEAPKDFPGALSYYIEKSGMSYSAIGKAIGKEPRAIRRWAIGEQLPSPKSTESVRKLENLFELSPGTLQSLLALNRKKPHVPGVTSIGQYLIKRSKERYYLRPNKWPEKCAKQFEALAKFKETDILPSGVSRYKGSVWRREEGNWSGTKNLCKISLSCFWGYLILPVKPIGAEENPQALFGMGMELADLGLENFLCPSLIENYINFKRDRSHGGHYNTQTKNELKFATSIVHPEHGFIWQYPLLFPGYEKDELKDLCAKAHARYTEIRHHLSGKYRKTRNPEEPCQNIIRHKDPLTLLIILCRKAQKYAEDRWAGRKMSVNAAIDFRNALILGMMLRMPLRAKNYCFMNWRADNTGHLNQRHDGSWWLDIPKEEFKNERGAAGDRPYSVQISKNLWGQIEFYLQKCRPLLLRGGKSDYLFLQRRRPLNRLSLANFYRTIVVWTNSFSPVSIAGFGPHAFRHLVATGMLKDDPRDVETVAMVLHDRVETVRKNYAHLLVDDGQSHFNSQMEKKQRDTENDEYGQKQALPALSAEQILNVFDKLSPAEKRRVMAGVANG